MNIKDLLYLLWYSVKSLFADLFALLSSLKKAKTWSFILYVTLFYGVYMRDWRVIQIAIPLVVIVYLVRQHKEPDYNRAVKEHAFKTNDEKKIRYYYHKYEKQCWFARKTALSYKEYKKKEIKALEKKHTELD